MWLDTTLTIANGQTESPELDVAAQFPAAKLTVVIMAPATLPEVVTIKTAKNTGGGYGVAQSGGSDIGLTAGKNATINPLLAGALKLVANGAVGADRVFQILAVPTR